MHEEEGEEKIHEREEKGRRIAERGREEKMQVKKRCMKKRETRKCMGGKRRGEELQKEGEKRRCRRKKRK